LYLLPVVDNVCLAMDEPPERLAARLGDLMRSVSGRRLFLAMFLGIVGAVVAILLDSAIAYLREDWSNPLGIALAAGVAALSGVIPLLRPERSRTPDAPAPTAPPWGAQPYGGPSPGHAAPYGAPPQYAPPQYGASQPRPKSHGIPALVGVLILLVLCGGGVAAAAIGAQYLGGFITGDESGTEWLAEETSAVDGPLTVTVHSVLVTRNFTRVELSAANSGDSSITLPVFHNCYLNTDRNTMEGDAFRSDWAESVPAGGTTRGTVVFDRLPDGVESVSLSFSTVFGSFDINSLTVADIRLLSPDRT
jgi:hypothetical protein